MRSRRVLLLPAVAIGLVVLVLAASLAVIAVAAPVLLVLEVALIALVAGLGSRLWRRSRGRTDDLRRPWQMTWKSRPPVSAVPFVRDQLRRVLSEWGVAGEDAEPTLLVVTELMSNAVDHAEPPVLIAVSFAAQSVRVEVRDAASEPPRLQHPSSWTVRGRGLQLVDALSSRWGWTEEAVGKTVWAEVSTEWPN